MKLHPHVAGLLPVLDPRWRSKIFCGGLVLCLPFVGWPAVLGYRARFVRHLFEPETTALPDWREGFWGFVRDGLRAMAVIFGYTAPLFGIVAWLVIGRGYVPGVDALVLTLGLAVLPIFSTLSLPLAATLLWRDGWLHGGEFWVAVALWALLVFLVPAGFLQVTLKGRHRHAFAIWRTVPFVLQNFRLYVAAWWYSGLMSICAHLFLPLAPWGVVWCYLGILALFNEVLVLADRAPGVGWLQFGLGDGRFRRRRFGPFVFRDGAGQKVRAVELGLFAAPLPGRR